MKKQKNTIGVGLIYLILLGLYNLIVFMAFKNRTNVFWISYAFVTIAFAIQIISVLISFETWEVETVFFGIPLASLSVYYLCVMVVVGLLFMIFQKAGATIETIIMCLITGIYLIIAITTVLGRDEAKAVSDNVREKVAGIRSVQVDVDMLYETCSDPELKNKLKHLSQTVKYSDPMTNASVANVEERIMRKVQEMGTYMETGDVAEAAAACSALELLYIERNKKLAASK